MKLRDLEEWLEALRERPVRTIVIVCGVLVVTLLLAVLTSLGQRLTSPSAHLTPDVSVAPASRPKGVAEVRLMPSASVCSGDDTPRVEVLFPTPGTPLVLSDGRPLELRGLVRPACSAPNARPRVKARLVDAAGTTLIEEEVLGGENGDWQLTLEAPKAWGAGYRHLNLVVEAAAAEGTSAADASP